MLSPLRRIAATLATAVASLGAARHRPEPPTVPTHIARTGFNELQKAFTPKPARRVRVRNARLPLTYWHPEHGFTKTVMPGGCPRPVSRKFLKRMCPNHPFLRLKTAVAA